MASSQAPGAAQAARLPIDAIPHRMRQLARSIARPGDALELPPTTREGDSEPPAAALRLPAISGASPRSLPGESPRSQRARLPPPTDQTATAVDGAASAVAGAHLPPHLPHPPHAPRSSLVPRPPTKRETHLMAGEILRAQRRLDAKLTEAAPPPLAPTPRSAREHPKRSGRAPQRLRWLPVIGAAPTNEGRLRECQENAVRLRLMVEEVMRQGHSAREQAIGASME